MKKNKRTLTWIWLLAIAIAAQIIATVIDVPNLMQNENRFRLFVRIIMILSFVLLFFFRLDDYRKSIQKKQD